MERNHQDKPQINHLVKTLDSLVQNLLRELLSVLEKFKSVNEWNNRVNNLPSRLEFMGPY